MSTIIVPDTAEYISQAVTTYLCTYPLVYNSREIATFQTWPNLLGSDPLPYDTFGHARQLLDPTIHFASPNDNTLYIVAMCDGRNDPSELRVPDPTDRYEVLQFVGEWANNAADHSGRLRPGNPFH